MMRLDRLVAGLCLSACLAGLPGCGYEEGFEYTTDAHLAPLHDSGIDGAVIIGYGIGNPAYRMRISLRGLQRDAIYQVRFFDAPLCTDTALASANHIDERSDSPFKKKESWGVAGEPIVVSGNFWGRAEQEFRLHEPNAPSIYGTAPDKFPAVVVYAQKDAKGGVDGGLERVACGVILHGPINHRPHT